MSWFGALRQNQPEAAENNQEEPDPLLLDDPEGNQVEPEEPADLEAMPNQPNYDAAHADDEADNAMDKAINALKNKAWAEDDLKFYFSQVEIQMKKAGVKSNFTKLQVLATILPKKVEDEIKTLLMKQEKKRIMLYIF